MSSVTTASRAKVRLISDLASSVPCLFVCIIGLLTTVNGNVTYPAVDEPTNWRALGFAFGLFLVLFVLGALWNRIKWIVLQKRNARKKHSAQPRTVINSKKS